MNLLHKLYSLDLLDETDQRAQRVVEPISTTKTSSRIVNRRTFLKFLTLSPLATAGCQYWPHEGMLNDCPDSRMPEQLKSHELVQKTWEGIDTSQLWDCHCHLAGIGDSDSGMWVNPNMQSLWHPLQYLRYRFYLRASCARATGETSVDQGVVTRVLQLQRDLPAGYRSILLAFDYLHDANGEVDQENSVFYAPNAYAQRLARENPQTFEWIASIHPYRQDAVDLLDAAVGNGARAIKWLPSVMGIDPGNSQCDAFYEALVKHNLPLLTHAGDEYAVHSPRTEAFNNPLLFRRALEHGVRVIFAHCATLGDSIDLDRGKQDLRVANLDLFARLMEERRWEKQVFGDISAITQVNRDPDAIRRIVENQQWHARLLFGTDYPLPGVLPLYSPQNFVDWGMLTVSEARLLSEVRRYNPILFDVMLKRLIKVEGKQLSSRVFETRRHFV